MSDPISEENGTVQTISLKNKDEEIDKTQTGINTEVTEEKITFDFFLNLTLEQAPTEKVTDAIAKSLDVENQQITEIKISKSNKLIRVQGHVATDEWEIKTLASKFNRLVPDRILSGQLQTSLELDDRPRVSRFYSKSSTNNIPQINTVSAYPLDQQQQTQTKQPKMTKTQSLRSEMKPDQPSVFPKNVEKKDVRENKIDDDDVDDDPDNKNPPHSRCCILM